MLKGFGGKLANTASGQKVLEGTRQRFTGLQNMAAARPQQAPTNRPQFQSTPGM